MKRSLLFVGVLAVALAGCTSPGAEQPEANPTEEESLPVTDPCSLFTESDLEAIFDQNLGEGTSATTRVEDNTFTTRDCSWNYDGVDVVVQVAEAADFDSGEFECAEPTDENAQAIEDLGSQAWWTEQETQDGTAGTLRACTENLLVDVSIRGSTDDPETFESQARAVAEVALAAGE